jgi:hypothetical protein
MASAVFLWTLLRTRTMLMRRPTPTHSTVLRQSKHRRARPQAAKKVRAERMLPRSNRQRELPLYSLAPTTKKKQTNRDLIGSRQTALETAQLLYRFVGVAKFSSIEALVEQIKTVGRRLVAANPKGGGGFVRLGRLVNARQADCETKTPHVLGSYVPRRARGR